VQLIAGILTGLVAVIHVGFLYLEMVLWSKPQGMRIFGTDADFAKRSAALAANQGLYNGFLAAGLAWGLVAAEPTGFQVRVFFLGCVIVAGLFGAATVSRRIIVLQALPAAIALVFVVLSH
jgi:putative membrane protein